MSKTYTFKWTWAKNWQLFSSTRFKSVSFAQFLKVIQSVFKAFFDTRKKSIFRVWFFFRRCEKKKNWYFFWEYDELRSLTWIWSKQHFPMKLLYSSGETSEVYEDDKNLFQTKFCRYKICCQKSQEFPGFAMIITP